MVPDAILAEREGFEPSVPVTQDARLAICPRLSEGKSDWELEGNKSFVQKGVSTSWIPFP
jgi:hypothetical protein